MCKRRQSEKDFEKDLEEHDAVRQRARKDFEELVVEVLRKVSSQEARVIVLRMSSFLPSRVIRLPKRAREDGMTVAALFAQLKGKSAGETEIEVLSWADDLEQFGRVQ